MIKFSPLLAVLLSTTAWAQEAPRPDAAAGPDSDIVVVTATRAATPIDRVAASVTVLDKAAIDRNQDFGVADLLLRTPGVTLSRNGGYGTNTSLRIRGAEPDQTVVVIDGVKLNDPSSAGGGYNFANLLVGDAARIEVLRGPQSILWGSQAIGGVVNIVTPLGERDLESSFDVEAGSRQTVSGRAAIGGRTGPLAWRVGAQAFSTQGMSALAPTFGGRDTDGYSNQSVQGRAMLDITSGVSADVRGYYSRGRTELDSTSADTRDYSLNREFVGYAGLNIDLFDARLRNRFAYGYTDTDRDNYNPARARAQSFDAAGRNERLEYQGGFAIAAGWNATFGVENERSRFRSVSPLASLATPVPAPAQGRAEITGVYAELNATLFDGLTLTGGVRNDDHNRFGSQTLFAGGAVWALPTGTVLRANYAEAFKAPTLYQLFSEFGNQALNPEEAKGWEAGAEQRLLGGVLAFGATYFERRTTNQIIYNTCPARPTEPLCFQPGSNTRRAGYYQNVARAFARGVEAVAHAQVGTRLTLDGNYSWTESEDRSPGATNGLWLPRRPRHAANASITYTLPHGYALGVAARWAGDSFDNAANTTRLESYTLVDLRAELPVTHQVKLFARVENLFDEEYQTTYRYGTLGRSLYAGFRGRF
ncbi:TonB-dependent receptor plug domain-containing protein [Sphingomonas xinjiangensis]|uniref:Vitamin B12 transporter n=1 Tax=Sphingomonas xinjiangensis TaxID=643568 RepID=A0A840YQH7_9SPHN|nr:TonB-dependent receptor [Sphingomonas xinjiangensis]MBB5710942.1 vitamin B12 transporter [Sphingomonas xinjiangensis]